MVWREAERVDPSSAIGACKQAVRVRLPPLCVSSDGLIDCGRAAAAPRALCETPQLPRDRFPLNYLPRARAIVLTKLAFLLPLIDK